MKQKFEQMYAQLNTAQKKAVDAVEGPVVVSAGPGTGKTQMLALRIANILRKTDALPENILALTFTNAGVAAMRERLAGIIGVETAYRVGIYTFHSFCEEQIGDNHDEFAQFVGAVVADEVTRTQILENVIKTQKLSKLKTFASDKHYVRSIMQAIDELKREGVAPDEFVELIAQQKNDILMDEGSYYKRNGKNFKKGDLRKDALKDIDKNLELAKIYERYQEELSERKLYDFADMVLATVAQIESDENYRTRLQEQYIYILVDEHQDTNDAQARLLLALGSAPHLDGRANIFAVGDVKQSIYRFAGASIANFQNFHQHFRDVLNIELTDNYRSTQNVCDSAYSVMAATDTTLAGAKLCAQRKFTKSENSLVLVRQLPDYYKELEFVAADIAAQVAAGVPAREIAVFYRNNSHLAQIVSALERVGVEYVVASTQNALTDNDLQSLFWLLRAVAQPTDDAAIAKSMLVNFVKLDIIDVLAVFAAATRGRKRVPLITNLRNQKFLTDAGVSDVAQFIRFAQLIAGLHKDGQNAQFDIFFERFVRDIGFLQYILSASNNKDKLSKLLRVFTEIKKQSGNQDGYRLDDFLRTLDAMEDYAIPLDIPWDRNSGGVRLMTAHGAKGLEFDNVYITNAVDNVWGKRRNMRKFKLPIAQVTGDIEDERRLFYVAMTRARKRLMITLSQYSAVGKQQVAVRFLGELPSECVDSQEVDDDESLANKAKQAKTIFAPRVQLAPSFLCAKYIQQVFFASKLSASILNNYYQSPLLYLFRNIVRLPQAQSRPLVFGNLIHGALESYFAQSQKAGELLAVEKLLEAFDEQLDAQRVLRSEYTELTEHGHQILQTYYQQHHDKFQLDNIEMERRISGVEFSIDDDCKLELVGVIDKMELVGMGGSGRQVVRVIDYKTGKAWSKMDKARRAKLHRQMTFYKLLLDLQTDGKYELGEAQLHFIDPNSDDVCEIYTFTPTDEEVGELRQEIIDFAQDVTSGEILRKISEAAANVGNDRELEPLVPLYNALAQNKKS